MAISNHVTTFANRKVEEFDPQTSIADPVGTAYSLRFHWDEEGHIIDKLERLLEDPSASKVEALVFGMWNGNVAVDGDSSVLVDALVQAKNQLKGLKAVFIGDITYDESEISWIEQSDISPILAAYPNLEVLRVRGGNGLAFSPLAHKHLKTLIVETGGLSSEAIAQICGLHLPALEHLELWLGSEEYGGDSIYTLRPILNIQLFPDLKYLGLRNSQYSDDIARAVVEAQVIQQIEVLDLSMGTLSDEGAEVLLNSRAVNKLHTLDVSENFLSSDTIQRLKRLNVRVIADNQKEEYDEEDYGYSRYCSVAE